MQTGPAWPTWSGPTPYLFISPCYFHYRSPDTATVSFSTAEHAAPQPCRRRAAISIRLVRQACVCSAGRGPCRGHSRQPQAALGHRESAPHPRQAACRKDCLWLGCSWPRGGSFHAILHHRRKNPHNFQNTTREVSVSWVHRGGAGRLARRPAALAKKVRGSPFPRLFADASC